MVMQTTMVAVIKVSVESIAVSQIVNKVKAGNGFVGNMKPFICIVT